MKMYRIYVDRSEQLHCDVEAESKEQALQIYYDQDLEPRLKWDDGDINSIHAEEVE